jgi:hypothetical protein
MVSGRKFLLPFFFFFLNYGEIIFLLKTSKNKNMKLLVSSDTSESDPHHRVLFSSAKL